MRVCECAFTSISWRVPQKNMVVRPGQISAGLRLGRRAAFAQASVQRASVAAVEAFTLGKDTDD